MTLAQAEFYSYAAFGKGLNATLLGGGPGATGGEKARLSYSVQQYATEIAQDEINHVSTTPQPPPPFTRLFALCSARIRGSQYDTHVNTARAPWTRYSRYAGQAACGSLMFSCRHAGGVPAVGAGCRCTPLPPD